MSHYTEFVKSASSINEAETILKNIYDENPNHWPNGLTAGHFDGGLYLVRKSASHDPVGFVGWQERRESGDRVGYYSVGISPEYRRHGFAKEAVTKLLAEKSAGVDVVKAIVMSDNKPSLALASTLGKSASTKQANGLLRLLGGALGGLGSGAVENKLVGIEDPGLAKTNLLLNMATGGYMSKAKTLKPLLAWAPKTTGLVAADRLISQGTEAVGEASNLREDVSSLADTLKDYTASAQARSDTDLAAAKARQTAAELSAKAQESAVKAQESNALAAQTSLEGNMWKDIKDYASENPWKTGLVGGGVGASVLGAYLYNALKKPNKPKPGVMTVEIPEGEVRDRFYTNLSRNMLFKDKENAKDKKSKKPLTLEAK